MSELNNSIILTHKLVSIIFVTVSEISGLVNSIIALCEIDGGDGDVVCNDMLKTTIGFIIQRGLEVGIPDTAYTDILRDVMLEHCRTYITISSDANVVINKIFELIKDIVYRKLVLISSGASSSAVTGDTEPVLKTRICSIYSIDLIRFNTIEFRVYEEKK